MKVITAVALILCVLARCANASEGMTLPSAISLLVTRPPESLLSLLKTWEQPLNSWHNSAYYITAPEGKESRQLINSPAYFDKFEGAIYAQLVRVNSAVNYRVSLNRSFGCAYIQDIVKALPAKTKWVDGAPTRALHSRVPEVAPSASGELKSGNRRFVIWLYTSLSDHCLEQITVTYS